MAGASPRIGSTLVNVTLVLRHFSDTDARAAVEDRLAGFSRAVAHYFIRPRSVHWAVIEEAESFRVSCRVVARTGSYSAHAAGADARSAAAEAFDQLLAQSRRSRHQRIAERLAAIASRQTPT
jgi:ribosome-associated translation inhibitor RaiA